VLEQFLGVVGGGSGVRWRVSRAICEEEAHIGALVHTALIAMTGSSSRFSVFTEGQVGFSNNL